MGVNCKTPITGSNPVVASNISHLNTAVSGSRKRPCSAFDSNHRSNVTNEGAHSCAQHRARPKYRDGRSGIGLRYGALVRAAKKSHIVVDALISCVVGPTASLENAAPGHVWPPPRTV